MRVANVSLHATALSTRCALVGGEIAYYRRASSQDGGRALVLIHGVGVSGESVVPTAERLAASHDVVVPDLPGFGRSSCGAPWLDTAGLADAVAAFTRQLELGPATFFGSSYGCQVVVEVALRHPELVAALALAAPTVDPAAQALAPQLWRWLKNFVRERDIQQGSTVGDWQRAGVVRVAATGRECLRHRMDQRLPLVRVPVLLLRGADDPIVPQRWLEEASMLVPGSVTAVVPGAAHSVAFTDAGAVAALVDDFVGTVAT